MRVTADSDPKVGASSEGNVLFERLRKRLTEESFILPHALCTGILSK
jgi:hypothetical protein